jgi:anti-sigma regulatory factor (Ser/Thr protein kinase)
LVNNRLSLTLRSTFSELGRLNRAFDAFANHNRLLAPVRQAVTLALEEVIVNVIEHGYGGQEDQLITVEICIEAGEVVVAIEDSAAAFNPLDVPAPDITAPLELRQPGGLGIHLTRKVMDGLKYHRTDGKNRLVLTKGLATRIG